MNHKHFLIYGLILTLAIVLGACGSTQAAPCPTQEAQSCPTAAANLPPEVNGWRQYVTGYGNIIFTFEPGDKCSMNIWGTVTSDRWGFDMVVNDEAHLNYMLAGYTVEDGHTIADVDQWNQEHPNSQLPPPFTDLLFLTVAGPMSRTFVGVVHTGEPIYFSCITEGPDTFQLIETFDDPLVVLPE